MILLAWITNVCGYLYYLRTGSQLGHLACFAGALLLTWQAFDDQPTVAHRPLHGQLSAADHSTISGPYVASTIKDTYHLPSCFYVRLMKHGRTFTTEQEAIDAGLEPCRECIR